MSTEAEMETEEIERRDRIRWTKPPRRIVLTYTAAFITAEIVGLLGSINLQSILEALFAFAAVNQAVFGYRTQRTAGLVMAALFSSRLLTLALPPLNISLPTHIFIIGLAGILVAYIATWVIGQDLSSGRTEEGFPLKRPLVSKGFTALITAASSLPIAWIGHALLDPQDIPIDPLMSSATLAFVIAAGCISVGALGEELLYRRLVAAMVQHTGQSQTPFISATLFAATYLATQNVGFVILMFFAGAFFAWSCERTGSLAPVVVAHAVASVLILLVL